MDGHYVPSILAAIGEVIEHHLSIIGFTPVAASTHKRAAVTEAAPRERLRPCSRCGQFGVIQQAGCDMCTVCGFSKCA